MTQPPLDYLTPQPGSDNPLKLPAILLLATGALTLGAIALDFLSRITSRATGFTFTFGIHIGPPESSILFNGISIILTLVMMSGAVQMLRLRNFPFAVTAAVLAVIPCTASCCCIFTMPVGIWALVLLKKPDTRSMFH
jgi:hypothetical protein